MFSFHCRFFFFCPSVILNVCLSVFFPTKCYDFGINLLISGLCSKMHSPSLGSKSIAAYETQTTEQFQQEEDL